MKRIFLRPSLSNLIGYLLILLGLMVMMGWLIRFPTFITIMPQFVNMTFNTALCFFMSGIALLTLKGANGSQKKLFLSCSAGVFILSGLTLVEYVSGYQIGIDNLFTQPWLLDQNPYPGRMAVNTTIAFFLTSIVFFLLAYSTTTLGSFFAQAAVVSIVLLGISALFGYVLKLEFLYSWYTYTRMALHTSIGFVLLGIGLGSALGETKSYSNFYRDKEDVKIILLSTIILVSVACIAGLAGFTVATDFNGIAEPSIIAERRERLETILPILLLSICIGVALLYWQVLPIIRRILKAKNAEAKLVESEAKFRLSFDYSPIGLGLVSLEGRFVKANKSLCKIVGYSEEELLQKDFQTITHPDDLEADLKYAKQLYEGSIEYYTLEKRYIRKDNKITWILLTGSVIRNEEGAPLYYIAQVQDINEKKQNENKLAYQAYYDTLTGLVNRNQLELSLEGSISSALKSQHRFAVFFLDIDHFKRINDTLGHDAGDELLKVIGDRLKMNTRSTDIAARLGGDEFILVLNGINDAEKAAAFAEKVINVLLYPILIKGHELFITASIGISFYPMDGLDYQTLIKSADLALYQAKEKGRNNYQFCTPDMNAEIKEKLTFKKYLQDALDSKEFYLNYQPKIDVVTRRFVGAEVLLRWQNPHYGNVAPNKIIPMAEEIGIIVPLSEWIIRTACAQAKAWQQSRTQLFNIAVNISTRQFMHKNFIETIGHVLKEVDLPAHFLELEVSEALIMQDPDHSLKIINALKKIGVQVIIDNFGTGYSSLNYLHKFAVDRVKIDRMFVSELLKDREQATLLITAMIGLAKTLGIKVLAEGVETKEQYELLVEMGCDEIQGYYLTHPLSAESVIPFIDTFGASLPISTKN